LARRHGRADIAQRAFLPTLANRFLKEAIGDDAAWADVVGALYSERHATVRGLRRDECRASEKYPALLPSHCFHQWLGCRVWKRASGKAGCGPLKQFDR